MTIESHPIHSNTRDSLLDAAEVLFVEQGIEGASLRAITHRAAANLAAVNYHFGSKEGLIRAVFHRRLGPIQDERLQLLAEEEARDGGTLEGVLRAFIAPALRIKAAWSCEPTDVTRLIGRVFHEPNEELQALLMSEFTLTVDRFLATLRRLLPHLPEEELLWRFHFGVGAMSQTLSCGHLLEQFSEGRCSPSHPEAVEQLVAFWAAGLRAPAVPECGADLGPSAQS